MRVEHWTNAVEQARHAVSTLLSAPGEAEPFESVPMFWSDQFDIKIQGAGRPKPSDELIIAGGTPESEKLIALYGRAGRLVGAVAFNQPPKLVQLRMLIAKRGGVDEALKVAES
jgi:NADPH-dependent 2,4-dienoyl-CoA reductase/sulfur reductase-like enzyme